jgi:hypothetical protein
LDALLVAVRQLLDPAIARALGSDAVEYRAGRPVSQPAGSCRTGRAKWTTCSSTRIDGYKPRSSGMYPNRRASLHRSARRASATTRGRADHPSRQRITWSCPPVRAQQFDQALRQTLNVQLSKASTSPYRLVTPSDVEHRSHL